MIMLTIKKEQEQKFSDLSLKKFEDDMVEHIKEFFPNHFFTIQEKGIRDTIQYGYRRAKSYDFTTQRNVCKYLNNMIILGSNFDADPMHPWVHSILLEDNKKDSKMKIDKLSSTAIEVMSQIAGETHLHLNRALLNLNNKSEEIFNKLLDSDLTNASDILKEIFPEKHKVIGEENLKNMIKLGVANAKNYGIKSEPNVVVYLLFMFLIGSGFDEDPQFSVLRKILNDKEITNENKKTELLFHQGMTNLKSIISHIKY